MSEYVVSLLETKVCLFLMQISSSKKTDIGSCSIGLASPVLHQRRVLVADLIGNTDCGSYQR